MKCQNLMTIWTVLWMAVSCRVTNANRTYNRKYARLFQAGDMLLREELFDPETYSPLIAPTRQDPSKTYIYRKRDPAYMMYHLTKLIGLDEIGEVMSVSVSMQFTWRDERLQWEPSQYMDVSALENVYLKHIWHPDFILMNSIDETPMLNDKDKVMISADGYVTLHKSKILTSPCEMDILYFPVDVQVCTQQFRVIALKILLPPYEGYSDLAGFTTYDDTMWYFNRSEDIFVTNSKAVFYPDKMTIQIRLSRKSLYYMNHIMAPVTILAVLVMLVFFIPPDAGEKIGFGVTLLLTFLVFQTMIDADLPASSKSTPLITNAMIMLQVCSGISILSSVIALNFHHLGSEYGGSMPRALRFFFFSVLAKLTFHSGMVKDFKTNSKVVAASTDDVVKWAEKVEEKQTEEKTDEKGEAGGKEWRVAALIVDRLLMYVCLITMVTVYGKLLFHLSEALTERSNRNASHMAENKELFMEMP